MTDRDMAYGVEENTPEPETATPRVVGVIPDKPAEKPKKKKRQVTLSTKQVVDAMTAIGEPTTTKAILQHVYGKDAEITTTSRSRVSHHLNKLREEGKIKATGGTTKRRYHLVDKPSPEEHVGLGNLFEVVGLLGSTRLVRSMDDHQVYKLEKL